MTTQDVHELLVMAQRERDEARAEVERLGRDREVLRQMIGCKDETCGDLLCGAQEMVDERARLRAEIARLRTGEGGWTATFLVDQIRAERERLRAELARLRAAQNERAIAELEEVDAYYGNHCGLTTASFVRTHIRTRIAALRAETPAAPAPVNPPMVIYDEASTPLSKGQLEAIEPRITSGKVFMGGTAAPAPVTPPDDAPSRPSVEELRDIDNTLESHDGCYDEAAISALRIAVRLLLDDALAARGGAK